MVLCVQSAIRLPTDRADWSFKITSPTVGDAIGSLSRDYQRSVAAGLLTKDPSAVFNPNICKGRQ